MDDGIKVWTTVGSAGTLNQSDLAKVTLHQSIIQLGIDFPGSTPTAGAAVAATPIGPIGPTSQAVVRYNVTPVDGLFMTGRVNYTLQIRYRGTITAKLMEVDLSSGTEKQLLPFGTDRFPPVSGFHVNQVGHELPLLDFISKGYYVEATLIAPQVVIGHPAAISLIKVISTPPFPG